MVSQFKIISENKKIKKRGCIQNPLLEAASSSPLQIPQPPIQDPIASLPPHPSSCCRWDCTKQIRYVGLSAPLDLWVLSAINMRERERESLAKWERKTNKFFEIFYFIFLFFHFIIINNFLYNIYDMARSRAKQWWRGQMIYCLVGT